MKKYIGFLLLLLFITGVNISVAREHDDHWVPDVKEAMPEVVEETQPKEKKKSKKKTKWGNVPDTILEKNILDNINNKAVFVRYCGEECIKYLNERLDELEELEELANRHL